MAYLHDCHVLKTQFEYFDDILSGVKRFEIRYNDRNFRVGDLVFLDEYCGDSPSNRCILCLITYVLKFPVGLRDNYVAFGFEVIKKINC